MYMFPMNPYALYRENISVPASEPKVDTALIFEFDCAVSNELLPQLLRVAMDVNENDTLTFVSGEAEGWRRTDRGNCINYLKFDQMQLDAVDVVGS